MVYITAGRDKEQNNALLFLFTDIRIDGFIDRSLTALYELCPLCPQNDSHTDEYNGEEYVILQRLTQHRNPSP
jgi:hypothetical protein